MKECIHCQGWIRDETVQCDYCLTPQVKVNDNYDSLTAKAELFDELIGHLTVLDDAGLMVFHGGYKEKQSLFLVKDILSKAKGL